MVTTEVAIFNLKDGLTEEALATSEVHLNSMKTVLSQPGCYKLLWGVTVEDKKKMYWLLEWENYEAHKAFIDSDIYDAFGKALISATCDTTHPNGPIRMTHHDFQTPLSSLLTPRKHTVEFFSFTAKPDASAATVDKNLEEFRAIGAGSDIPIVFGRAREDENVILSPVVWESVKAHMEWRETEAFTKAIGPIRAIMTSPSVHHIILKTVEPEAKL